jgi:hypothetical protein
MHDQERALHAAKSYAFNEELKPKIEERMENARSQMESYLLRTGQTAVRLRRYQIELRDGHLHVSMAPPDGWEQAETESE